MFISALSLTEPALVLLSLGLLLLVAYACMRLASRLHLPAATAYILAGVAVGPCALNLVPQALTLHMDFLTDLALACIAFGAGRYLRPSSLKETGRSVIWITLLEALLAAAAVSLCMLFVFHLPLYFSLLLGAIGCATAPASTLMTIRQYKAKGRFVDLLVQVVAMDDAVALLAFSACAALVQAGQGSLQPSELLLPLLYNLLVLVGGLLLGLGLAKLCSVRGAKEQQLLALLACLLLLCGLCGALEISPLLACMGMGASYSAFGGKKSLYKQLNGFTPPILALFFLLSGMGLDLELLPSAGLVGIAYFLVRILGKMAGAALGAALCKEPAPVRRCLGLGLVPQAGVSIGLAVLGQRMLPGESGAMLSAIILSSAVLYELLGPLSAKLSLRLSGSLPQPKAAIAPAEAVAHQA